MSATDAKENNESNNESEVSNCPLVVDDYYLSQEVFLELPWVLIRTFGPRVLGLWVWPGTHQSPGFKL